MTFSTVLEESRLAQAIPLLKVAGFHPVDGHSWFFRKGEITYDLSAADLGMLDFIEQYRLFVVN